MDRSIIEVQYPLTFRQEDTKRLGEHLMHRQSVELIGMKRVGISNFLRFFLYHADVVGTYISKEQKHVFIPVDLNDLVERELYPFWSLTLKRILDVVERSDIPGLKKKEIESLFLGGMQSQELFLLIDNVRRALIKLVEANVFPTLFFLRFDRIKDVVTPQFFDNLQGLNDATHQKVAYVFTSFRRLNTLSPSVFTKQSLSVFTHPMYIKPAAKKDMEVIFETFKSQYKVALSKEIEETVFKVASGHVQYLQLALILLNEKRDQDIKTDDQLLHLLVQDERIVLQSEELWESLTKEEKTVLQKIKNGDAIDEDEKTRARYLFDGGFVRDTGKKLAVFSQLFDHFLSLQNGKEAEAEQVHFSKKEHLLFTVLKETIDEICERETIIEAVWPEYKDLGVSDWAIDRLVARVRVKLKQQKSLYEIKTIRTRGYRLVSTE
ncbi:MAG TPA: helix-turn-helix domain-containing protein [Patescibacteria group bacterium]|nr:helix-turn-helix domain-containing protein [Patescibacteria group bacterium]